MNTIAVIKEGDCTGCGACAQVCPRSCIEMKPSKEGFLHPAVEEDICISCGKCLKVCTAAVFDVSAAQEAYAAVNCDADMLKGSSSGGMFPLLAKAWIQEGGYVCAAEMLPDLSVKHTITNEIAGLRKMQGSKYVQSNACDAYVRIKELLDQGKKVMFVGTPCQVSAVRNMFAKNLEQLLLVDLICHGVPNQAFFLAHINNAYNNSHNPEMVLFRDKPFFEASSYRLTVKTGKITKHVQPNRDSYYNLFLKSATFRESCYVCKYAQAERVGDITIGDCNSGKMYSGFPYGSSISVVILSTEIGKNFWSKVKSGVQYCDLNLAEEIRRNHQLRVPSKRPEIRDTVYQDFDNLETREFEEKYTYRLPLKKEIKRIAKNMLPLKLKGRIKKIALAIRKR